MGNEHPLGDMPGEGIQLNAFRVVNAVLMLLLPIQTFLISLLKIGTPNVSVAEENAWSKPSIFSLVLGAPLALCWQCLVSSSCVIASLLRYNNRKQMVTFPLLC